jgi:hypothetical protein
MKSISMLLLATATLLYSCQENKKPLELNATIKDTNAAVVENDTTKKTLEATTIEFIESEHDFGTINEGQIVEYDFKFKNTGTHPLVIADAKASCGCTIPEWTKDPVLPGKEGTLKVKYNSTGKDGKIHKTVSVFANTTPEVTTIDINVVVKAKDTSMGPMKK